MVKNQELALCERCIKAIESRGENIFTGPLYLFADEAERAKYGCYICGEYNDLYECIIEEE